MRAKRRGQTVRQRGQALVEFALIAPALIVFVEALPLLSAGGFGRMTQAVASAPPAQSAPLDAAAAAARRDRLAVWQRGITTAYLVSLIGAFVAGQIRNRIERKSAL